MVPPASISQEGPRPRARGFAVGFVEVLDQASKAPRSLSVDDAEPILARRERARAELALRALDDRRRLEALALLASLDGADAPVKRAFWFRALAARSEAVAREPEAWKTLKTFARTLSSLPADAIRTRGTVLDLDWSRNTSTFDPVELWARRGTIHARGRGDRASDNDGLHQRFTASCGPTVLQMMVAEADPVTAFLFHGDRLAGNRSRGLIAEFQRSILERLGGVAIGRVEATLRSRLKNALGRLQANAHIASEAAASLRRHVFEKGPFDAGARLALDALRAHFTGFPSDEELGLLQRGPLPRRDEGVGSLELTRAINTLVTPLVGVEYAQTSPEEGFARGQAWRHLDEVARALRSGLDVPFGIVEPAHWMLMTAVRGRKPHRSFLVSDPDGGRTAWVLEKDLRSGRFADVQFHLSTKRERPYVDSFLLPVRHR